MTRKHLAKSGKSAGTWVTCTAQQACRNKGLHVPNDVIEEAKTLQSERTGSKVTNKTLTQRSIENILIRRINDDRANTYRDLHTLSSANIESKIDRVTEALVTMAHRTYKEKATQEELLRLHRALKEVEIHVALYKENIDSLPEDYTTAGEKPEGLSATAKALYDEIEESLIPARQQRKDRIANIRRRLDDSVQEMNKYGTILIFQHKP